MYFNAVKGHQTGMLDIVEYSSLFFKIYLMIAEGIVSAIHVYNIMEIMYFICVSTWFSTYICMFE